MRYLLKIVVIVTSLLFMAMAVCAGEDRSTPWFDQALECEQLSPDVIAPVAQTWPDTSPCAGESKTTRLKAMADGTVRACEPAAKQGSIWQNGKIVELTGDKAEAHCASLCKDPAAPDDASRCSSYCKDRNDPSKCDPALTGLAWRLPETGELETLLLSVNNNECTIQGCRQDPVLEGPCDYYWAIGLQNPDDAQVSDRSFTDMRGGGVGYDGIQHKHPVRCVADRP